MPVSKSFNTYSSINPRSVVSHRVYAKVNWSDAWTEMTDVFCLEAKWACLPAFGSARLYYRYGPGALPVASTLEAQPRYGLNALEAYTLENLAFVRVDFEVIDSTIELLTPQTPATTTLRWYGVVGTMVDVSAGDDVVLNDTNWPVGIQTFNCVGLEWLMDRDYITQARVTTKPTFGSGTEEITWSSFAPPFNDPIPNRSPLKQNIGQGSYTFWLPQSWTDDTSWGDQLNSWSTRDAVEYLLYNHRPINDQGFPIIEWELDDSNALLPDWDQPVANLHGVRVWQLLGQLIPRHRCIGAYLHVERDADADPTDANADVVTLKTFTFSDVDIPIPDSLDVIKANASQVELTVTADKGLQSVITTDAMTKFDRVRVVGNRAVHAFTTNLYSGMLIPAWTDAEENDYVNGPWQDPDFPISGEEAAQERFVRNYREKDTLQNVYAKFRINPALSIYGNFTSHDGFPVFDYDENTPGLMERNPFRGSLSWSPLPPGEFYGIGPTGSFTAGPYRFGVKDALGTEVGGPFKMFVRTNVTPGFYADARTMAMLADNEGDPVNESDENRWSATVQPLQDELAFMVRVNGEVQHIIAGERYRLRQTDQFNLYPDTPENRLVLDQHYFTVAVFADYFAESLNPPEYDPPNPTQYRRERVIFAGNQYRLDWVTNYTVIGANPKGEPVIFDAGDTANAVRYGLYVRDDRNKLKAIAGAAFAWYSRDRKAVSLQTPFISDAINRGDLITTMHDGNRTHTLNSVVTEITISFGIGSGPKPPVPSIQYQTDFAEFDIVSFVTKPTFNRIAR